MLTIAHPPTPHLLNLTFVSAQITASANVPTIARPPCLFSAAPIDDAAIPLPPAAPHERFPVNRFAPLARSPTATPSAPESVCSRANAEIDFQMPASA